MSASFSITERKFTCRKCGETRRFQTVGGAYTKREMLKLLGMRNSRWGISCLECPDAKREA